MAQSKKLTSYDGEFIVIGLLQLVGAFLFYADEI